MSSDTMQAEHRGTCLCGAVSVQILASSPTMGACHCKTCRAWSGGPFMSVEYHDVPQIQGMEHVTVYSSSDLQVFIDQKPQNYQFANTTRTMTGEEVFNAWS